MAVVTFTNNWSNILDKLQSIIRTEFKGALPTFVSESPEKAGSQYLRLDPVGSELVEYNSQSETREFTIDMILYFSDKSGTRKVIDAVLRLVSRIEALIHDNTAMTLSDSTQAFNCRLQSTELNADDENTEFYVVQWSFQCSHLGNVA